MSSLNVQLILSISRNYTVSTSLIIIVFGIVGHLFNIFIFMKIKLYKNNPTILYFIFESIVNIYAILFQFSLRLLTIIYGSDLSEYSSIWCKLRTIIGQTLLLSSLLTVCCNSINQYLSTSYLIYLREMSNLRSTHISIGISICFSLIHSLICGIQFQSRESFDCVPFHSILNNYYTYFFYPILVGLFPIIISSLFSLLSYRHVRRILSRQISIQRRRLHLQLTKFVLLRVFILVILLTPVLIYRIYFINRKINPNDLQRLAIERLILAIISSIFNLNYAVNFYIFILSSSRYRRHLKLSLVKQFFSFTPNQIEPIHRHSIDTF